LTSVLFVTTNGTGLGHLTRCMAIGRRLPREIKPLVFTLSKAIRPVRGQGFFTEHFPSRAASGLPSGQWNARLAARLSAVIAEYRPEVVAFDGVFPYRGLRLAAGQQRDPAYVWIRRPMWQPDADPAPLAYSDYFDRIIEPGEFAAAVDVGPTVERRGEAIRVDPITFCEPREILDRPRAEAELGLDPGRPHALIQLGEMPSFERDFLMQACLTRITRESETQIAILESAISRKFAVPASVVKVAATYPIARFYRAFDFVISAAGYNSYHELVGYQIPAAFFPVRKPTDDQPARARYAAEVGVAVETGLEPSSALQALLSESERQRMSARGRELAFGNGAVAAAEAIAELARDRATTAGQPTGSDGEPRERGWISLEGATVEDLQGIDGIGGVTAQRIIEFRDGRGGLSSLTELEELEGVEPRAIAALWRRVRP
jgi:UDP:flavonoid glycosyltransferase YjiC (YdhE family)